MTGLWGLAALAALAGGHRLGRPDVRAAGLVWLGAVLLETVLFDTAELDGSQRGYAFLVAAAALLVGALVDRLSVRDASGSSHQVAAP